MIENANDHDLDQLQRQLQEQNRELRDEQALIEAIIRSTPGIFYVTDESGRVVRWNKMLEELSGYSGDEIGQMRRHEFCISQERNLIAQKLKQALDEGHATTEVTLRTKSGDEIPMYSTGERVEYRGPACVVGMAIDITAKRKEKVDAVRRAEAKRRLEGLDERERAVMRMIVHGALNKVIAARMRVSMRTVDSWRHTIMEKTGAKNAAQLAAIAVLSGDAEYQDVALQ